MIKTWTFLATGIALTPLFSSMTALQSCGATTTPLAGADIVLQGVDESGFAGPAVSVGDINGDGYGDILVGSPLEPGSYPPGRVYVFYGPVSGTHLVTDADEVLEGASPGDEAGTTIVPLGDFNQDGYDDFMVGAAAVTVQGKRNAGAVYVVYGPLDGRTSLAEADLTFLGQVEWDFAYIGVPAGDLNADGHQDLAISSTCAEPDDVNLFTLRGCTYVFNGPLSPGTRSLSSANAVLRGEGDYDMAYYLTPGGDLNEDGFDDLLVGAPEHDNGDGSQGCVYVKLGPISGTSSLADADSRICSDVPISDGGDSVGYSTSLGDANGDGHLDLLTGAMWNDLNGYNAGATALFYGPFPRSFSYRMSDADSTLMGDYADGAGITVSMAGDANGDGYDDLLISAPWDDTTGDDAGAAYLVYGPPPASVVLSQDADETFTGIADDATQCVFGRDLTGDGYDEIFCDAGSHDSRGVSNAGEMYVFWGHLL